LKRQETIRYLNLENPNTLCFLNSSINALIQSDSVYNLLTDSSIDNQNDDVNDIIKELRLLISGQINNASKLSTLLGFNEGKQEDAAIPLEFMLDNCKEIILKKMLDCGIDFGIQEQWIDQNTNNIQVLEDYILKIEKRNSLVESVESYFIQFIQEQMVQIIKYN